MRSASASPRKATFQIMEHVFHNSNNVHIFRMSQLLGCGPPAQARDSLFSRTMFSFVNVMISLGRTKTNGIESFCYFTPPVAAGTQGDRMPCLEMFENITISFKDTKANMELKFLRS